MGKENKNFREHLMFLFFNGKKPGSLVLFALKVQIELSQERNSRKGVNPIK
jgi:hypothetical protein